MTIDYYIKTVGCSGSKIDIRKSNYHSESSGKFCRLVLDPSEYGRSMLHLDCFISRDGDRGPVHM